MDVTRNDGSGGDNSVPPGPVRGVTAPPAPRAVLTQADAAGVDSAISAWLNA
jgi:hypothetical protein